MSDTTTLEDSSDELPELVESEYLGSGGTAEDTPLKTRVVLPFLVPLLSIAIVAVLVLNISRVFLSDNEDTALALAIGITLAILVGAAAIAAAPRLKTSSLAVILGLVFVGLSISGLATLGHSLDDGEGAATGYVKPTGKPTSQVSVEALATIKFNATEFTATKGVVQLNYGGATGHTLAIQDPQFDGFLLTSDAAGPKTGNVELAPGKYTLYCTVPGHEAQGMKATLTVS